MDARHSKTAETYFRILKTHGNFSLVEPWLVTGRAHQIRVPLAEAGLPIVGDELYGRREGRLPLGLRVVRLAYLNPFTKTRVEIRPPTENFLKDLGLQ